MKQVEVINRIFKQLGGLVELQKNGQSHWYYAVLQPVRDRSKQFLEHDADLYGWADRGHILYYGPACDGGELLNQGDLLTVGKEQYLVKRCEPFYHRGESVYRWGVLQHVQEEGER